MAYTVTALVRRARLPKTIRHRPLAKLCLYALADRCDDSGSGAWPSLATIAAESEVDDVRTVRAHLRALNQHGLIFEQAPPRRHRPRTWSLNLDAIMALDPVEQRLLFSLEAQPVAPLTSSTDLAGEQSRGPEEQLSLLGGQFEQLDRHAVAPDPVLRSGSLNDHLNVRVFDQIQKSKKDYGGDLAGARAVIRPLLTAGINQVDELLETAHRECVARGIDLGAADDHVVARAVLLERLSFKFARAALPISTPKKSVVSR